MPCGRCTGRSTFSAACTTSARWAVRGEDAGGVEAAQERGLHLEQFGRLTHRHGRVVLVVELGHASGHLSRRSSDKVEGPAEVAGPVVMTVVPMISLCCA